MLRPPELADELPELELADEPVLPELLWLEELELPAECCAVACALLVCPAGSATATPAVASRPAAPAATVIDRSLDWCRSLAAIASWRDRASPVLELAVICSSGLVFAAFIMAVNLLQTFCAGCGIALAEAARSAGKTWCSCP